MRFELHRKGVFEVSGIKRIVVNTIERKGGVKVKCGKTHVWEITQTKKGLRWLKYDLDVLEELKKNCSTPEEYREFADKAIIEGMEPVHMHKALESAMHSKWVRIWFSGETINVERNITHFEHKVKEMASEAMSRILFDAIKQIDEVRKGLK